MCGEEKRSPQCWGRGGVASGVWAFPEQGHKYGHTVPGSGVKVSVIRVGKCFSEV